MQNFIEKASNLTEEEINELLYYYQQGIDMGKEEILVQVINNLNNLNITIETISEVTQLPISKIKQYID